MNPRNIAVTLAVLLAGLAGFAFGRWSDSPTGASPGAWDAELAALRRTNVDLRADVKRLTAGSPQITNAVPPPSADRVTTSTSSDQHVIARLNGLVDAKKQKLAFVNIPVFDRDGRLDVRFVGLFGLSAAEVRSLQTGFDAAQQRLNQLTAAHATVRQAGDTLIASVQSFDGSAVYDQLMDQAQRVLGRERYAAFVALCDHELSRQFASYGAEEQTVTVTRVAATQSAGAPLLNVHGRYRGADGLGGSHGVIVAPNALPPSFGWLTPFATTIAQLPVQRLPPFPGKP